MWPRRRSTASCGPNAIRVCRRTAASARTADRASQTSRSRSATLRPPDSLGLLAIERKDIGDVIGYCGLVASEVGAEVEPEIAFELLRRVWRQGYATEASLAVMDWARSTGIERLWATVWDWNIASRRTLAKLGFEETDRVDVDPVRGTSLHTTIRL